MQIVGLLSIVASFVVGHTKSSNVPFEAFSILQQVSKF